MNRELIKKLAIEATDWCIENSEYSPKAWDWEDKFTELLVKECGKIATEWEVQHVRVTTAPYHLDKVLKDHFGVK